MRRRFSYFYILLAFFLMSTAAARGQAGVQLLAFAGDTLRTFDPLTGKTISSLPVTLSGAPLVAFAAAVDPASGTLYALANVAGETHIVTVDAATGAATDTAPAGAPALVAIAFTSSGDMFGIDQVWGDYFAPSSSLYKIDKTTGAATLVADLWYDRMDDPYWSFDLVFDPARGVLRTFATYYDWDYAAPAMDEKWVDVSSTAFPSTWSATTYYVPEYEFSVAYIGAGALLFSFPAGEIDLLSSNSGLRYLSETDAPLAALASSVKPACTSDVNLYAAVRGQDGVEFLYYLDKLSGAAHLIGPTGFDNITGIAFGNNAMLLALGERPYSPGATLLLSIDSCTGAGTEIGPTDNNGFFDLAVRPGDGALFSYYLGDAAYTSGTLATFDMSTGLASDVGDTGTKGTGNALSFDVTGQTLYQAVSSKLFSVDQGTGASTPLSDLSLPAASRLNSMDVDPASGVLFASLLNSAAETSLVTVTPDTGAVNVIAPTQTGLHALAFRSGTAPAQYVLTVLRSGAGSGTVNSAGGELNCGGTCQARFAKGTNVELTVVADTGYQFAGWRRACSGSGDCKLVMDADRTVEAAFRGFRLLLDAGAHGNLDANPAGAPCSEPTYSAAICYEYEGGTAVTITASSHANYEFLGWLGSTCSTLSGSACSLTIQRDTYVGANFRGAVVCAYATGPGSIRVSPPGDVYQVYECHEYPIGASVSMTATPDSSANFVGWSGLCSGIAPVCTITGSAGVGSLTATFSTGPDTTAPTVTITNPAPNSIVSGGVSVAATATDNAAVVAVQFKLDGNNLGPEDTNSPYAVSWDTTLVGNGQHTLTADARDAAGNHGSATVSVNVNNAPPADTTAPNLEWAAPVAGAAVSGTTVISISATDNVGIAGVQFKVDGVNFGPEINAAPYSVTWDTARTTNGSHNLSASARDAAGNVAVTAAVSVTVNNSVEFGFSMASGSPSSATVAAGGTATYSLRVAPTVGFTGSISFACTGTPLAATCSITPNPAAVSGHDATAFTVAIKTTGHSVASSANSIAKTNPKPFGGHGQLAWLLLGFVVVPPCTSLKTKRARACGAAALCLLVALMISCGSGGTPAPSTTSGQAGGTPAGTYTVTVTGTSGDITHSALLTVTVTP